MRETPEHIKPLVQKMEDSTPLTEKELLDLILWECELGGITIEELREIRRTGTWPPGKHNVCTGDAELLLGMLED
jgi:hypothetical protein